MAADPADKVAAPPSPPLGWVRSQPEVQPVPTLPLPPAVPQGQQRTCLEILTRQTSVLSWGSNTAGQLGLCACTLEQPFCYQPLLSTLVPTSRASPWQRRLSDACDASTGRLAGADYCIGACVRLEDDAGTR